MSLLCICSSRCTAWSRKVGSHIVRWAMATYVTPLEAQFTRAIDRPWMAYVAIVLDDTSLPEKGQPFGGATVFSNGRGWCAFAENGVEDNEELIPSFDGAVFSQEWKDALWARFSMGAPRRQRWSVERYRIVMSGRRPLIKGLIPAMGDRGCGNVSGLLMQSYDRWLRWCPLICWLDPESELEVPVVLGLRLFLPESWTNDVERMVAAACRSFSRRRAPSPGAPFRRSTGHGARRALRPGAGRCRLRPVRVLPTGLSARGLAWAVGIPNHQKVYGADVALVFPVAGRGRPRKNQIPDQLSVPAEAVLARARWRKGSWRRAPRDP